MNMHSECDLSGLRILVVEDEHLPAMAIEALLLHLGCEFSGPIATLEEALAAVADEALDGVILDVNLCGKRSDPVAAALIARGIPFIVLTGDISQCLDNFGDMPRLFKPVPVDPLIDAMLETFLSSAARG